jgi:hypothetical protein
VYLEKAWNLVKKSSHCRRASGRLIYRFSVSSDVEVEVYVILKCDVLQFGGWGTHVSEALFASIFRVD